MFAVERTANIKVDAPKISKYLVRDNGKITFRYITRRVVVFHFLASQQKVKRKIYSAPFASLR